MDSYAYANLDTRNDQNHIWVPNIPVEELRIYVRILCQVHVVKNSVSPDHVWFSHHMSRLQRAVVVLKRKYPEHTANKQAAWNSARVEAILWLKNTNANASVRSSVLESLKHGLPQIDNAQFI